MKHRNHMIVCAIVAVIAIGFLVLRGSSPFGAGFGLVLLLCPLVMGTMMWLMMRQPRPQAAQRDTAPLVDVTSSDGPDARSRLVP